jgi:flagellar biosynthesis protein FliR
MPWSLVDILIALPVFAAVLFRIGGLVMTAPVLASSLIPMRIRAAFTMVIAAMIFPIVNQHAPADMTLSSVLVSGVTEFMIGAAIGLSLMLVMVCSQVAGTMVSQQAGLAMSQVANPLDNVQTTAVAQVYTAVLTLVFLIIGGHRAAISALLDTYKVIPLFSFQMDDSIVLLMIELLTAAFIMGVRIAGPVIIALFLTETAVGFVSRTVPQLNIMTIGFGIRLMVTFAVAAVSFEASQGLFVETICDGLATIRESFGVGPGF